jgi:uncharacterized repeat protein (TIGR01451 family)
VTELKRLKVVIGLLVTLAVMLSMLGTALPAYAADVAISKGVTPTTPNVYRLGDTIHYTMSITNLSDLTGANENVVVEVVRDVLPDGTIVYPSGPTLPYTLTPGETQTYTYDWVATVSGTVVNTFYASGYQISTGGNDDFEHQVQKSSLVIDPSISVEKYVWDGGGWQDADAATGPYLPSTQDPVIFAFEIENDGIGDLTNVNLVDTDMTSFYINQACTTPAVFPITVLADDDPIVTVYGKLTFASGQHSNNATVTGTPAVGDPVSDSDLAHYFGSAPSIDLEKQVWDGSTWHDADTPAGPSLTSAQNPVIFRFVITNNDNVNLTNVTLTDTDMSSFYTNQACTISATFPIPTLATSASVTVYGKLPWAEGQHSNNATVTGTPPVGPSVSDSDPAHYLGAGPSIDVEKYVWDGATWQDADTAPGPSLTAAHDPVVFRFVITNTGNVDLTAVNLTDTDMSSFYTNQNCTGPAAFPIPTLSTNTSVTVYGCLPWAEGQHSNNAMATGAPPVGPPISDTNPAYYFGPPSSIDVEKYVWDGVTWHDADAPTGPYLTVAHDPVVFRFVITNNCGVNLTAVNLTDTDMSSFYTNQNCTGLATFPIPTLSTNTSVTVFGCLPWADGQHSNNATASGAPPAGDPVSDSDLAHYFGSPPAPAIDIEKHTNGIDADTAPGPVISINGSVTWTYIVTNIGTVNLTGIVVTDDKLGLIGTITSLPVSATQTLYAYGTAVAGQYANNATVIGYYGTVNVTDWDPSHYYNRPTTVGWETYPIDKTGVLLPWIAFLGAIIAGAGLLVLRRRRLI